MLQLLPGQPEGTRGGERSSTNNEGNNNMLEESLATGGQAPNNQPRADAPTDELFFNQSRPDFAQARERCARAIVAYNNEYFEATKARRADLWLDIVDPARLRLNFPEEDMAFRGMEASPGSQQTPLRAAQDAVVPDVKPCIYMDYGLRVRIDPNTFINTGCVILDTPIADVTIGPGTNIGPRVSIYSVGHSLAQDGKGKRSIFGKPVTIEGGCWIGGGTTIMPGVTIGAHSTVGAGSIVTRSIPAGVLAHGQPARVVRSLDRVTDGPPAAFASARSMTLREALQLGVDGARHGQVRREIELLEVKGEMTSYS